MSSAGLLNIYALIDTLVEQNQGFKTTIQVSGSCSTTEPRGWEGRLQACNLRLRLLCWPACVWPAQTPASEAAATYQSQCCSCVCNFRFVCC